MKKAEKGNKLKVHYTGRLDDDTVFDSSRERAPLEFTVGEGRLIKGFEDGVLGMGVGEKKTVNIPAAEAYGEKSENLVINVPRDKFPPSITPEVGIYLNLRQPDGGMIDVIVTEVREDSVTLDGNHPLAGKDLTFEIELVEIL